MRPLCFGMRSHPYLLSLFLSLNAVEYLPRTILPTGFVLSLLCPHFYLGLWWFRRQLARGDAVRERANWFDSGRAAASRERFTPAAAAEAVSPTYLLATVADFHTTY